MVESGKFGWAARTDNNLGCTRFCRFVHAKPRGQFALAGLANSLLQSWPRDSRLESEFSPVTDISDNRRLKGLIAALPVNGHSNSTVVPLNSLHKGVLDFDSSIVGSSLALQKIGKAGCHLAQDFNGYIEHTVLVAISPDADQQHIRSEGKLLQHLIDGTIVGGPFGRDETPARNSFDFKGLPRNGCVHH